MKNVLYVEDDAITRILIRKLLELNGHTVLDAGDGAEALSIIQENKDIEYVLLDLNMPVMNGFEFLKIIEQNAALHYLKVIITSAIPSDRFKTLSVLNFISQDSIIGYLEKPIHFPDLAEILLTN